MTSRLHLNVNILNAGVFGGSWRFPGTDGTAAYRIEHYTSIAKKAEEAKLDAVFLADAPSLDPGIKHRTGNNLEPTTVLARIAAQTERIGLIGTLSSSYNDPVELARRLGDLDYVSGGRLGWNVVTTAGPAAARNFGRDGEIDHAVRYRRAAEVTQQVHTTHEDLLFALLRFPDGLVGLLDVNWLTPEKQRRLVVLGEEGMFQVDYLTQRLTFTRGRADLDPTYLGGYAPTIPGETIELPVEPAEPLARQLDAFLATVRDGVPPAVSGEEGMWAVRLADLLLESASTGRAIDLERSGAPR